MNLSNGFAQQVIRGTVTDATSREPLMGVSVYLGKTGVTTDINGDFSFNYYDKTDTITLTFSYIGYVTQSFQLSSGLKHQILLVPTKNQLDEAVVTGNRNALALKRQTVSTDLIKPYLIESRITNNLEQVMSQLPGVQVVDGQLNIRNGSGWTYGAGSRVQVLVDDVPMITGDAGIVQWKFLPTDNIASMEVIKGASSVMYGSGSLNGIVNIRTATPGVKPRFQVNVFNGAYSNPSRDSARWSKSTRWYNGANLLYAKRFNQLDFTIGLNALNDQGYRLGEFDKRLKGSIKTNYRIKRKPGLSIGADLTLMTQQSASFLLWESYAYGYTSLDSAQTKTRATVFSVDPHADWVFSNFKLRYRGRFYGVDNDNDASTAGVDQDNFSLSSYNELTAHYFLPQQLGTIALGTTNNYTLSQSPLYGNEDITSTNQAGFIQLDLQRKRWTFSGGVRYEYFTMRNHRDDQFIGRIGLGFEASKSTFLRASVGQAYRYPTIAERYIETSVGLINIFPNPSLSPEKGYSAEVGIKQGFSLGSIKGYADVAAFTMEYDNMIEFNFGQWRARTFNTPPPTPFIDIRNFGFSSFNIGKARISGLDLSITGIRNTGKNEWMCLAGYTYTIPVMLEPTEVFTNDSSASRKPYTYNFTSTDTTGNPLKYRYKHLAKLDLQYTRNKIWMVGVSLRYNSYMENIDKVFVVFPINFASPGVDRGRALNPDGDFITDLRGAWYYGKWTLTLTINNLFNTEVMGRPADLRPTRLTVLQLGYKW